MKSVYLHCNIHKLHISFSIRISYDSNLEKFRCTLNFQLTIALCLLRSVFAISHYKLTLFYHETSRQSRHNILSILFQENHNEKFKINTKIIENLLTSSLSAGISDAIFTHFLRRRRMRGSEMSRESDFAYVAMRCTKCTGAWSTGSGRWTMSGSDAPWRKRHGDEWTVNREEWLLWRIVEGCVWKRELLLCKGIW